FPTDTTDIEFLARANKQMHEVLDNAWEYRAKDLPYTSPYEALIMASIIEKETAVADERPEIAGVFVRRLQKGMRLQTDPTVIYGIRKNFDGNLRKKDLTTDTLYNTYTRSGLPPTPICLPSRESINAALHPASGDSLYFVATGTDGRHIFSSNLADHNKAVRKYQLKK
ncbi:MAG: endolytic transglycosylase MltG, partial [Pseudomonadota bacterium]|nr:endolytic transglycosylase MltG [Pseudomonadota bacterium]